MKTLSKKQRQAQLDAHSAQGSGDFDVDEYMQHCATYGFNWADLKEETEFADKDALLDSLGSYVEQLMRTVDDLKEKVRELEGSLDATDRYMRNCL